MSDIIGSGYGDSHDWQANITDWFGGEMGIGAEKGTRYFCRHGDAVFVHFYDLLPDIFAAMRAAGVPETCRGTVQ